MLLLPGAPRNVRLRTTLRVMRLNRGTPFVAAALLIGALQVWLYGCGSGARNAPSAAAANGAQSAPNAAKMLRLEPGSRASTATAAPVLVSMKAELARSVTELGHRADPPPYYIAYEVMDERSVGVEASLGALVTSADDRSRSLDVDVRVGTQALDNTHPLRGEADANRYFTQSSWMPLSDDSEAIASVLWFTTHLEYERAVEDLIRVRADREIKVAEEDESADFSREPAATFYETPARLDVDRKAWEERVRRYSQSFADHPEILDSSVQFEGTAETRYFVNSERSEIQIGRTHARLTISASAMADDGMNLGRMEILDSERPDRLPNDTVIRATVQKVVDDLLALRRAPLIEPYTGPAILDGRAAGVFFHEIFGHRVEGHRQKMEEEGQTFSRKIGEAVMPPFLDVYDDPTIARLNGIDLNGFYPVDDEGVTAQRASLVDHGILRGFLMSRSPTRGFDHSNGHGRRQRGFRVVARQGNLIVDPSVTTTKQGLKDLLVAELRRQNKPFGLRFTEITGGYTNTMRADAQAFKVLPVMVYKIYPDGHEELVRGVDLEGTPLTVLSKIIAAANDFEIFNGVCGAESGWVPVSAASPSLLVSQIEVARREKDQDRPPLLPPPQRIRAVRGTQGRSP